MDWVKGVLRLLLANAPPLDPLSMDGICLSMPGALPAAIGLLRLSH